MEDKLISSEIRFPEIRDCISFQLNKAAQAIGKIARDALAPLGVTPTQYAVLNVLWHKDGLGQNEIGSMIGLDSPAMTGLIDRLERASMCERRPDRNDRRAHCIWMTDQSRAAFPAMANAMAELNDSVDELLASSASDFRERLNLLAGADRSWVKEK